MAIALGQRVVIADDHAPTRAHLRRVVEEDGFIVCAEVSDADEAIRAARTTTPDVVLLDVRMPGGGVHAAEVIATRQPKISIVMLTVSADDHDLFSALAAGASGYLLKGQDPRAVPEALRTVLSGEAVLPRRLVKRLVQEYGTREMHRRIRDRLPGGARLTRREWEVLELLNDGLGTSEIASRLYVADVTVRTHITAIIRKLQVENRDGALRLLRGEAI
jgi:DNA-binding NarL/FixJ family response regulator